jgi:hypothetical protein
MGMLDAAKKLINAGSSLKGNPDDAQKVAPIVPGGKSIRNRNGYGAYQASRQTQGLPTLSLAEWLAGKPDADDEDNALTTRLK